MGLSPPRTRTIGGDDSRGVRGNVLREMSRTVSAETDQLTAAAITTVEPAMLGADTHRRAQVPFDRCRARALHPARPQRWARCARTEDEIFDFMKKAEALRCPGAHTTSSSEVIASPRGHLAAAHVVSGIRTDANLWSEEIENLKARRAHARARPVGGAGGLGVAALLGRAVMWPQVTVRPPSTGMPSVLRRRSFPSRACHEHRRRGPRRSPRDTASSAPLIIGH